MRTLAARMAKHEERMARADRHVQAFTDFLAADILDEIEEATERAEAAHTRGDLRYHSRLSDRVEELKARLAKARAPLPPHKPLVFPVPATPGEEASAGR